ncbi:hypothetical protein Dimus_030177 [Dionaea muscipula]
MNIRIYHENQKEEARFRVLPMLFEFRFWISTSTLDSSKSGSDFTSEREGNGEREREMTGSTNNVRSRIILLWSSSSSRHFSKNRKTHKSTTINGKLTNQLPNQRIRAKAR